MKIMPSNEKTVDVDSESEVGINRPTNLSPLFTKSRRHNYHPKWKPPWPNLVLRSFGMLSKTPNSEMTQIFLSVLFLKVFLQIAANQSQSKNQAMKLIIKPLLVLCLGGIE